MFIYLFIYFVILA